MYTARRCLADARGGSGSVPRCRSWWVVESSSARTRTRPVALSGSVLDAIGRRVWIVVPQAAVDAYQPASPRLAGSCGAQVRYDLKRHARQRKRRDDLR